MSTLTGSSGKSRAKSDEATHNIDHLTSRVDESLSGSSSVGSDNAHYIVPHGRHVVVSSDGHPGMLVAFIVRLCLGLQGKPHELRQ